MTSVEIESLEEEIKNLEETLALKRTLLRQLKQQDVLCKYSDSFCSDEVVRYSRQMIMPQIAKDGQISLKNGKVLIVGAGGLGCPASLYLAAAGVGEIHIIDYDEVELSNLHRQILHYEKDVGRPKAQSAADKLKSLNSNIRILPLHIHANSSIIEQIKKEQYRVVLDCTDNAPTRYLLNDVCVMNNIPLVSGSALQMEGQLTVYHYRNGPCYRCLFPTPPPARAVTNCGDGGVLGSVAGVIGVLQALETVKILTNMDGVLSGKLLLFDGSETIFRNVKLRGKLSNCHVCGDAPTITSPIDYEEFCGSKSHDKVVNIEILKNDENVGVEELDAILKTNNVVVDVRPELEYSMCRLLNTVNFPYTKLTSSQGLSEFMQIFKNFPNDEDTVYFLCRRGNDSQRAVDYLKRNFPNAPCKFVNVRGGLYSYSTFVDPDFPVY